MTNLKIVQMDKIANLNDAETLLWRVAIRGSEHCRYFTAQDLIQIWSEIKYQLDKEFKMEKVS